MDVEQMEVREGVEAEEGATGVDPLSGPPNGRLRVGRWFLLVIPLLVFTWAGELGLDFGRHWDEGHRIVDLSTAARDRTLLPAAYNYPSMCFNLGMVALLPDLIETQALGSATVEYREAIAHAAQSHEFMLQLRRHYVVLTAFALIWVFASMLALGRRPLEALFAACLLMGSFELSYHSRWAAPDAIMMQFVALTVMALIQGQRKPAEFRWLILAAVGAGLAGGTKYLGALLTVPLLLLVLFRRPQLKPLLIVAGTCLATFLLTTPGALIQPWNFFEDLAYERAHYQGGHDGFTVEAGFTHFSMIVRYLFVDAPSVYPRISMAFVGLGLLGIIALWRESKQLACLILILPVIYVVFLSQQSVMFVRNLLLLLPFAAILSARGLGVLLDIFKHPVLRVIVAGAAFGSVGVNAMAVLDAGRAVHDFDEDAQFGEVYRYLEAHPELNFQLSRTVNARINKIVGKELENAHKSDTEAEYVVVMRAEILERMYWPSNDPELYVRVFGPPSANYAYYSTWPQKIIVVLEREKARELASIFPPPGIEKLFPEMQASEKAHEVEGLRKAKKDAKDARKVLEAQD
ncbi:MAG: hypothetical protein ACI8X5_002762 [Planctomycetota bacterium]|jgi:hypothetical protein